MVIAFTPHFVGQDFRGEDRAQILEFMRKLVRNPTSLGLHVEPVKGAKDGRVRTGRVTQSRRAVMFVLPENKGFVIDAVLEHEPAYRRAERVKLSVDPTGTVVVVDEGAIPEPESIPVETPPNARPVLREVTVDQLVELGVGTEHAERALRIVDSERFEGFCEALPERHGLLLLDLAAGKPWVEVKDEYARETRDTEVEDVETVLLQPNQRMLVFNGEEALERALAADLKSWRIWLHPLQESIAYHDGWGGPFRVTGGAGTGKTVAALHRTLHLATRPGPEGNILLVTFTTNLAHALRAQLADLAGGGSIPELVDVKSIDSLAHGIANQGNALAGWSFLDPSDRSIGDAWSSVMSVHPGADAGFAEREWREVVLSQGITTLDDYFDADRSGMGTPLNRSKRTEYWAIFSDLHQTLRRRSVMTHSQVAAAALKHVMGDRVAKYAHTVVDEAQDMTAVHWKLLRALTEVGPDDMFVAGDANQRIYGRPLELSRYGIDTRGRSRRLTVNYRTSAQILRSCLSVASAGSADDLEGESETLRGARSVLRGPQPDLVCSSSPDEEDLAVAACIRGWIEDGLNEEDIGVLCPTIATARVLSNALGASGISAAFVEGKEGYGGGAVAVMTMHRAKGLEYRAVAVTRLGLSSGFSLDERALAGDPTRRALLYVAMSRARDRLALFASTQSCESARRMFALNQ